MPLRTPVSGASAGPVPSIARRLDGSSAGLIIGQPLVTLAGDGPHRAAEARDGHAAGRVVAPALNPRGDTELRGARDLWYFPRGYAHAIQTVGEEPLYAILAFDCGLYAGHGTFGLSDWMNRFDAR